MAWHEIANAADINEGEAVLCESAEYNIALFKDQGQFYALKNHCPHRGGPLVDGDIENGCVTCPWHGWEFKLQDGQAMGEHAGTQAYPLKVEANKVWVDIN